MVQSSPYSIRNSINTLNDQPIGIELGSMIAIPGYSGAIHLHDSQSLQHYSSLSKADGILSQVKIQEQMVWAAYKSGHVRLWDPRTASVVAEYVTYGAASSFDSNSNMLAIGTELVAEDVGLDFYDLRTSTLLAHFDECHSDDITAIQLHPLHSHVMMSGSTDGLINLYDLSKLSEGQDEALYQIIKSDSVSTLGFFGPEYEYIYNTSHMETFSIYKFNEGQVVKKYGDVRGDVEYLVGAHYEPVTQKLMLLGGRQDGGMGIFDVQLDGLEPLFKLEGGHSDIVRGFAVDDSNGRILTAGEDGRVCDWVR